MHDEKEYKNENIIEYLIALLPSITHHDSKEESLEEAHEQFHAEHGEEIIDTPICSPYDGEGLVRLSSYQNMNSVLYFIMILRKCR